ncbi:MAG: ATP-binding protein [Rhodocyclales bacterium]|nr:ATP-binding protein [Rhodocyclales bacterium]
MEFADLAAITIHDVKNRLALLANRADAKGDAETVRGAMEAALTLTRLLVYYRSEKGQLQADIDAHVPADLLQELAAEAGRETSLALRFNAGDAPTLWFYDEALVRLVMRDALYNAMRHSRSAVTLQARLSGDCLEFAVLDDGPGFSGELLGQSLGMQALSREGTGLGLYLARRVARLHDSGGREGCVELRNEGGAVFCLRLPR